MIDANLLKLLCCPESHQTLRLADEALVQTLNQQIAQGALKNRGGQLVKNPLDGGLIREDGKIVYPVVNKLPVLLVEEGIPLP